MSKIIVIGSPGAGKSVFARKLRDLTKFPLYYLDMLWHKPDQTTISQKEFDTRINELCKKDSWILDGNYLRTLAIRLFGAQSRIGKKREDLPWIESEFDETFKQYIIDFPQTQLPQIYGLLEKYRQKKNIIVFKSRKEADNYLKRSEPL